ncbi:MAG TPA: branched-chain amino acid ABC transporter permease [Pseudonocardiaceae bacterium]|jgi:branched-chain amino acid transport system permease protein|nr:branched-chain amino acid ABC transporter permease [Pseudonocardiaceae bacterium]
MLQVLLSGLAIGGVYGLVALGFAIAFYVTRVINFAQGQLLMVAVMVTAALSTTGLPTWLAALAGLVGSAALGVLMYFVAVGPVLAYDRFSFAWLVSTLGVAIVLETGAAIIWGPTSRAFPAMLNNNTVHVGTGSLTLQQLLTVVVALLAVAGFELVRRFTLFGKLGMAISADPEMARAVGSNTRLAAGVAFGVAGLLAGVAGVLIGPITFANPYLGDTYGIAGFVALMIGGIERPAGAMAGGFILGLLDEGANHFINSHASDWFPFVVVVAVLLLAPRGLFSSGEVLRRLRRTTTPMAEGTS